MKLFVGLVLGVFTVAFLHDDVFAQTLSNKNSRPPQAEEQAFADSYRKAVNTDDWEALKSLVCPSCLEKFSQANAEFMDDLFKKDLAYTIPDQAKTQIAPIPADEPLLFESQFDYPIRPMAWLQIDWNIKTKYDGVVKMIQLGREDGRLCIALPIPTEAAIETFKKVKQKKLEIKKEAQHRFEQLKDPLLLELRELLKEGHKIDAIKKYAEQEGVSLDISKDVIELLRDSDPQSQN